MRQFKLAHARPSADGKHVTATIVDPDWDRFTIDEAKGVSEIGDDDTGNPRVRFPAHMLVFGNILDLDR